jgi:3'-phosphoadenosine 5'-phosphosulfate (PAPS) 3'-phosphatase
LSACIFASQHAGEIIQAVWKSGELDIKEKGKNDPFTQADLRSQQLIMGLLRKQWPELAMVGEENVEIPRVEKVPATDLIDLGKVPENLREVPIEDVCVYIDPLDATREYTLGNLGAVITLIGIAVRGVSNFSYNRKRKKKKAKQLPLHSFYLKSILLKLLAGSHWRSDALAICGKYENVVGHAWCGHPRLRTNHPN